MFNGNKKKLEERKIRKIRKPQNFYFSINQDQVSIKLDSKGCHNKNQPYIVNSSQEKTFPLMH